MKYRERRVRFQLQQTQVLYSQDKIKLNMDIQPQTPK